MKTFGSIIEMAFTIATLACISLRSRFHNRIGEYNAIAAEQSLEVLILGIIKIITMCLFSVFLYTALSRENLRARKFAFIFRAITSRYFDCGVR